MDFSITTTTGRVGIRGIGDVFSSCQQVMIRMTSTYYKILCDGIRRPPFDEDTHNNQPKTGGDNLMMMWMMMMMMWILDGRHSMRIHTTTNQKQAAIMEDKERWHYHQGGESPTRYSGK